MAEGDRPRSSQARSEPEPLFVDVAAESGIDFVHENGAPGEFCFPELVHAGAALLDFDDDSWLDVYLVQSGPLEEPSTDRARRQPALSQPRRRHLRGRHRTAGSAVAATASASRLRTTTATADRSLRHQARRQCPLPQQRPRRRWLVSFTDVTAEAGVGDPGYSSSAAFFDFDRDGDLDLYVCNYLDWSLRTEHPCLGFNGMRGYCSPAEYPPQSDTLYRNDGRGDGLVTFTDVSERAGMRAVAGPGLGVVTADFDGDGWVDVFVANDQMPNHLWINSR